MPDVPEPTTGAAGGACDCGHSVDEHTNIGCVPGLSGRKVCLCDRQPSSFTRPAAVPSPETAPAEGLLLGEQPITDGEWQDILKAGDIAFDNLHSDWAQRMVRAAINHTLAARVRAEADAAQETVKRVRALVAEADQSGKHVRGYAYVRADDLRRALDGADTPATDAQDGAGGAR